MAIKIFHVLTCALSTASVAGIKLHVVSSQNFNPGISLVVWNICSRELAQPQARELALLVWVTGPQYWKSEWENWQGQQQQPASNQHGGPRFFFTGPGRLSTRSSRALYGGTERERKLLLIVLQRVGRKKQKPETRNETRFQVSAVCRGLLSKRVGPVELLVTLGIALALVGPEGLVAAARSIAQFIRDLQPAIRELAESSSDITDTINKELG
eukprot:jgi/Bigna1/81876/fgenesh1_pg.85_\